MDVQAKASNSILNGSQIVREHSIACDEGCTEICCCFTGCSDGWDDREDFSYNYVNLCNFKHKIAKANSIMYPGYKHKLIKT